MTKIDIFSGFLGAGKTTLIKKLLSEAYKGEQVVLIENEFGEIGIDGGFLKEAGIEIREMNSGCICCSLVGDFGVALKEVIQKYSPDRIIIEPSGVGKLSDVIKAVQKVENEVDIKLNSFTTVVDVTKCKMYMKNFGEFFSNQIEYAGTVILSRTDTSKATDDKVKTAVEMIRSLNQTAAVITTPIQQLSGTKILDTMENNRSLEKELLEEEVCPVCGGHHEHHHDHEECECGHDHAHHDHAHHEHEHHHPTEIAATLKTAAKYPHKTTWCVFQPHTYTRTKALLPEFAEALALADKVVLADIYAARETDTLGISSRDLRDLIAEKGVDAYYFSTFDEIEEFLLKNCIHGDVLITMGAGDVYKIGENLLGM